MLLADIFDLKAQMGIASGDTTQDKKLSFLLEAATNWIEEFCCRSFAFKNRTEYYWGKGTQKLNLRSRPVYTSPTILVYEDAGAYWGSASGSFATLLTYGTDFALDLDQDDGTSRSGILFRINAFWQSRPVRSRGLLTSFNVQGPGNIKVVYSAGFTVDNLPAIIREACEFLVMKMNHLIPMGMELGSESYEERSVGYITPSKRFLMSLVAPMLNSFINRSY